jgi:hypothetical protein
MNARPVIFFAVALAVLAGGAYQFLHKPAQAAVSADPEFEACFKSEYMRRYNTSLARQQALTSAGINALEAGRMDEAARLHAEHEAEQKYITSDEVGFAVGSDCIKQLGRPPRR